MRLLAGDAMVSKIRPQETHVTGLESGRDVHPQADRN